MFSASSSTCIMTFLAFSISASRAIRAWISKRMKFFEVRLVTSEEATVAFGMMTVILSRVKIWVVRSEIKITRPSLSPILIQSPTLNDCSSKIVIPEIKLAIVDWAAKPTAKPKIPRPATNETMSKPNWAMTLAKPSTIINTEKTFLSSCSMEALRP